jgi:hypothetical protein
VKLHPHHIPVCIITSSGTGHLLHSVCCLQLREKRFPKDDKLLHWELHNKVRLLYRRHLPLCSSAEARSLGDAGQSSPGARWPATRHIVPALQAVSNVTGTVTFSAACSSELCSIQSGGGAGDSVQATTVDDFVASLPGSSSSTFKLDILKIDTEGEPAD